MKLSRHIRVGMQTSDFASCEELVSQRCNEVSVIQLAVWLLLVHKPNFFDEGRRPSSNICLGSQTLARKKVSRIRQESATILMSLKNLEIVHLVHMAYYVIQFSSQLRCWKCFRGIWATNFDPFEWSIDANWQFHPFSNTLGFSANLSGLLFVSKLLFTFLHTHPKGLVPPNWMAPHFEIVAVFQAKKLVNIYRILLKHAQTVHKECFCAPATHEIFRRNKSQNHQA